jgi:hypothetical protein
MAAILSLNGTSFAVNKPYYGNHDPQLLYLVAVG